MRKRTQFLVLLVARSSTLTRWTVLLCVRSVQVIGYYGYVNRLVAGLGVPFGDSSATLVEGAPGL